MSDHRTEAEIAHGRLVVGAIEMTWLFAPGSFPILSEFLAA
jgi:hypothetical protein